MVAQRGGYRLAELWMEHTDMQAADLTGPGDTGMWMVRVREDFWDRPRHLSLSSAHLQGCFLSRNTLPPTWVTPGPSTAPSVLRIQKQGRKE